MNCSICNTSEVVGFRAVLCSSHKSLLNEFRCVKHLHLDLNDEPNKKVRR